MTRFPLALLLTGLALLAGVSPVTAQAPPPPGAPAAPGARVPPPSTGPGSIAIQSDGGQITVVADHLEAVGADNLLVATGNVEITKGTSRITSDRAEINRATGDAVALGRVILYDGEDRITGERIDYNLNSGTGVVYQGEAHATPYYRIGGQRLERIDQSHYKIRRGIFTTCEDDPPTWSFRFGEADADMESSIFGLNGSFWVKQIPLIPFVPFFAAALRRERQTGFLFPRFGSTTRKGYFYEQPFYWNIADNMDATVTLDYYQLRGVGANAEFRYLLADKNRGQFDAFFIKETASAVVKEKGHDDNRGWLGFKHDWAVGPGLTFRADINGVTDDLVLREYGDRIHERSSQRVESNVFLTKSWSQWTLTTNVLTYQDLTSPKAIELYRLPDIKFSGTAHPFTDVAMRGFTYAVDANFTDFYRQVGSDGLRFDVRQRVSQPFTPGGYFTITPFVAGRLTAYSVTANGTGVTRDGTTSFERVTHDPRLRPIFEAGTDLEARASRIYLLDGFWNLDAMLHAIEPRVNYTMVEGSNFDKLPQWTETDSIQRSSTVTYSLTNRLRARTVSPIGTEPLRWDLARFTLSQNYNLADLNNGQNFGLANAELLVEPRPDTLRFRANTSYDQYKHEITQTSVDLSFTRVPFVTSSIGYTWAKGADFLRAGVDTELSRYLVVHGSTNWDLLTNTFVENRAGFDLRYQCWAFTVEFVRRATSEDEVRFALNLLGLGAPFGTTAGVGALTGTALPGSATPGAR
ncbi:MAG: LPS-assembly protein LptD [Candidatus Rokubacteria bacterium]|nr:LPS-assembly protein LptD [Candidatus Rokubacteria bacterium]